MERGRLDVAAHPFCTNFSVGDVRLTTRFQEFLPTSIFGTLHEAGHGMYEQGSPMEWDRLPVAGEFPWLPRKPKPHLGEYCRAIKGVLEVLLSATPTNSHAIPIHQHG
ncbi:MAG: hypothetical protein R2688_09720 [Fimbriimonadaceae bacterium]